MFVTNWLTWNAEMMQANCSNSQQYHVWLSLYLFVFQHSASVVIALWAVAQQTKLRKKGERGSISSDLETLQIPAGLWGTASSCPLYRYPPVMSHRIICSQAEKFSAEERFPATAPLWVGHVSLPVGRCGLESGNICDTYTARIKPSLRLRISRVIMSHAVPVG